MSADAISNKSDAAPLLSADSLTFSADSALPIGSGASVGRGEGDGCSEAGGSMTGGRGGSRSRLCRKNLPAVVGVPWTAGVYYSTTSCRWVAYIRYSDNRKRQKSFCVGHYGHKKAKMLAVQWKNDIEKKSRAEEGAARGESLIGEDGESLDRGQNIMGDDGGGGGGSGDEALMGEMSRGEDTGVIGNTYGEVEGIVPGVYAHDCLSLNFTHSTSTQRQSSDVLQTDEGCINAEELIRQCMSQGSDGVHCGQDGHCTLNCSATPVSSSCHSSSAHAEALAMAQEHISPRNSGEHLLGIGAPVMGEMETLWGQGSREKSSSNHHDDESLLGSSRWGVRVPEASFGDVNSHHVLSYDSEVNEHGVVDHVIKQPGEGFCTDGDPAEIRDLSSLSQLHKTSVADGLGNSWLAGNLHATPAPQSATVVATASLEPSNLLNFGNSIPTGGEQSQCIPPTQSSLSVKEEQGFIKGSTLSPLQQDVLKRCLAAVTTSRSQDISKVIQRPLSSVFPLTMSQNTPAPPPCSLSNASTDYVSPHKETCTSTTATTPILPSGTPVPSSGVTSSSADSRTVLMGETNVSDELAEGTSSSRSADGLVSASENSPAALCDNSASGASGIVASSNGMVADAGSSPILQHRKRKRGRPPLNGGAAYEGATGSVVGSDTSGGRSVEEDGEKPSKEPRTLG
eukprot:GHVQ01037466.1.p1 GENE.GHVQ01037466.1~~GHVQ01037466.1.p1  ORF type:complete len:781 (-),score=147.78 GHVQ01037466.1:547-2592(-)